MRGPQEHTPWPKYNHPLMQANQLPWTPNTEDNYSAIIILIQW